MAFSERRQSTEIDPFATIVAGLYEPKELEDRATVLRQNDDEMGPVIEGLQAEGLGRIIAME
jgi:hypothetical protein